LKKKQKSKDAKKKKGAAKPNADDGMKNLFLLVLFYMVDL